MNFSIHKAQTRQARVPWLITIDKKWIFLAHWLRMEGSYPLIYHKKGKKSINIWNCRQSRILWTCPLLRNMPELVRTSLSMLFPDSLSATIDFSSLSLAYSFKFQKNTNNIKRVFIFRLTLIKREHGIRQYQLPKIKTSLLLLCNQCVQCSSRVFVLVRNLLILTCV